ncbi:MAG TPA: MaoC family dehydratase [Thermodesulfobacteriota bacterium]|nr:MaoC family dehydratase [Thermodesulfobacteriota bacterium]
MEIQEDKPELLFADLPVGRIFRPLEYPITPELVQDFIETVGDRHQLYDEGFAPPGLAAIYARLSYLQDHTMPSGGVLAKQGFEFQNPIKIRDILKVQAKVIESYQDEKMRKRVTFLIEAQDQKGMPVSTIRLYAIWPK